MFLRLFQMHPHPIGIELDLAGIPLAGWRSTVRLSGRKVIRSCRRAAMELARNAQASSATSAPMNGITGQAPCSTSVNPNATLTKATSATTSLEHGRAQRRIRPERGIEHDIVGRGHGPECAHAALVTSSPERLNDDRFPCQSRGHRNAPDSCLDMPKPFTKKEIETFFARLKAKDPDPKTELVYRNPYTLLVAVVLSAQATDKGVNKATAELFKIADTPQKMVALGEAGLTQYIKTIGLYRNKAKNVIALSKAADRNMAALCRMIAMRWKHCRASGARRRMWF
jgi:hypothetical protein